MSKRLNLVGPAFEQPEYSLLAREKVHSRPCSALNTHTSAADSGLLMLLISSPQSMGKPGSIPDCPG